MRIKESDLKAVVDRLNDVTGNNPEPYTKTGNEYQANIGNYHIDCAYGGYSLHQMNNKHGGVKEIFSCGHILKRDLYNRMQAYLAGMNR